MNAALQWLFASPTLNHEVIELNKSKNVNKNSVTKGFLTHYYSLLLSNQDYGDNLNILHKFIKSISNINPQFNDYGFQDSHEFISAIFEGIGEELNRQPADSLNRPRLEDEKLPLIDKGNLFWNNYQKTEDNIITDLFGGQLVNIISCNQNGHKFYDFDNFTSISLEIPITDKEAYSNSDSIPLERCFEETTKVVEFDLNSGFKCKEWNGITAIEKCQRIWRLSKLLIIHIKRFSICEDGCKKNYQSVEVPIDSLDLYNYWVDDFMDKYQWTTYSLYGVIHHWGSLKSGHYTSEVRNICTDKQWYHWNDEIITRIDEPCLIGETPYVLFYYRDDFISKI